MNWLEEAVKSYKEKILLGLELYSNINDAIEYANNNSTVGSKAKIIAIDELGMVA